jgi:hypothetical protein
VPYYSDSFTYVCAYFGVRFCSDNIILKYTLQLQFNSSSSVSIYLYTLFAWLALIIFRVCILLYQYIHFYMSVSTTIRYTTHFHSWDNWVSLNYDTSTKHVLGFSVPSLGDTIYSQQILNCNYYGSILQNIVNIVKMIKKWFIE